MLLDVAKVGFTYTRRAPVLRDVTFSLSPGERVALIGPNGSGKSTLIRLLADLLQLRTGSIRVDDHPHGEYRSRLRVAYVASNDNLPQFLTGHEFVDLMHRLYRAELEPVRLQEMFDRYGMRERQHDLIEDYSHGMRKKVQVIATLLLERPLTIIDETLNGVDSASLQAFTEDVRQMPAANGLLFCSHDFDLVETVCDRLLVLSQGGLRHDLPMDQVRAKHGSIANLMQQAPGRATGGSS